MVGKRGMCEYVGLTLLAKLSVFSKKFPPMSLFDVAEVPTACVPLKVRAVSAALTGAVPPLQSVPALHCAVPVDGKV